MPGEHTPGPVRSGAAAWLHALTTQKFFTPCKGVHPPKAGGRDTLLTFFDLEGLSAYCHCCRSMRPAASRHELQIRRSTYHEVVKLADVAVLTDVNGVQSYVINGDKVVFLQPRPQPRPPKGCAFPSTCLACNRHLMDAGNTYCSLRCKLDIESDGATLACPGSHASAHTGLQPAATLGNAASGAGGHHDGAFQAMAPRHAGTDGMQGQGVAHGQHAQQRGAKRAGAHVLATDTDAKENAVPLRAAKLAKLGLALHASSEVGSSPEEAAAVLSALDQDRGGAHRVLHPTMLHYHQHLQLQQLALDKHGRGHAQLAAKAEPSSSGATSSRSQSSLFLGASHMPEDSPLSVVRPCVRQRKHKPHRAPLE